MENNPAELIEELMAAINEQDYVETLKLQKNASVEGKTASHPVDLYWEFADDSLTYKTLISTETLNTAASRADIIKMAEKVRDIYGQATGILFSRPIYDQDAKKMAANIGISVCELLPSLPDVWEPAVDNFQINADADFVKSEKERLGITEQITVANKNPKQLFLYDQNFICTDTVQGVIAEYVKKAEPANTEPRQIDHVFAEPTFLQTGDERIPFVKIAGVSFTLAFELVRYLNEEDKKYEGERLVEFILDHVAKFVASQN
ncbi:MAG: hypothetical protein LBR56_01970 [Sporomusaceae bacterium]|jgi:hypothetical protein|nr:hypothetical protein [Sporomusaceae bacterium]